MADRREPTSASSDPVQGEVLPPTTPSRPDATAARALVGRLVRGGDVSPDLLQLVDGPLAEAVSKAADYAGKAIAPGTVETYKADWADFARWARHNGVDPAILPVHPVVVAAWLATLAPDARWQRAAPAGGGDRLASPQPRAHLAGRARGDPADLDRHRPQPSPAGAAGRGADLSRCQAADRGLPR